jgi:RNA polymerase sigma-70 factor (ECF subfamily)
MTDQADKLNEMVLVLRCQTGDEDAYRELVTLFGPRLTYFVRKLVGGVDKADDLVQEVWLDVLRQLPRLHDAGAFRTWLYRIAYGKAMLDGRRNGWMRQCTSDVQQIADEEEATFAPEEAAQIHKALDRLELDHREVLVLRFLEELSYEEISQVVGCPVGTVRSRIYYAKANLRRLLK